MAMSGQTLDILGERHSGQDVRTQNGTLYFSALPSTSFHLGYMGFRHLCFYFRCLCLVTDFIYFGECSGGLSVRCEHCQNLTWPSWSRQGFLLSLSFLSLSTTMRTLFVMDEWYLLILFVLLVWWELYTGNWERRNYVELLN